MAIMDDHGVRRLGSAASVRRAAGGASVVLVEGEIDASNAAAVGRALDVLADGMVRVTLDLRRLSFLDCAGAREFERFDRARRVQGRRTRLLVAPGGEVARFFSIAGLVTRLDVRATLPAIEAA